jgi:Uma2 family endonuclease
MTQQTITIPRTLPAGEIVAAEVSEDDYMQHYAEDHHEWIRGVVVKMSPVSLQHDQIITFLRKLLETYFALRPTGVVVGAPFVMRLAEVTARREPDLQVILNANPGQLRETYMDGPADICIEVVSPGSETVDYGEKLAEYERGAVGEYWLTDPLRRMCHFYRLADSGLYSLYTPDSDGNYTTSRLPGFRLHVPTLWEETLPDIVQVVDIVRAMLKDE